MPILLHNGSRPILHSLEFRDIVLEAAHGGSLQSHFFIVPTRRRIREVEREIVEEHVRMTGGPIERMPIATFDLFVREFHSRLAPIRRELTPGIQLALIYRAMQKSDLAFFGNRDREPSPSVAERIARVISGVRADGIMPSDFRSDLDLLDDDKPGYSRAKLADLYQIYSEYLRLLIRSWSDHPGRMADLAARLTADRNGTFRKAFPEVTSILVHGFREFTPPEVAILQQLGYVRNLQTLVYLDYEASNGPLYGNFSEVVTKLTASGYRRESLDALQEIVSEEERRPFGHHMRKNLFRTDERIENSSFDALMTVYGFHNREEEVQGICARIKRMIIGEGIRAERICITTHHLDPYGPLLAEHLAAHGIPSIMAVPSTLDRSGLLAALLAALAVPAGSYERRDVVRAITSPYLDFGPEIDAAALVEASGRLRIRRGRMAWERRIDQRIIFLRGRIGSVDDQDEKQAMRRELDALNRALRSIQILTEVLDPFSRRMTPVEFRTAFRRLIGRLRVADRILSARRDLEKERRTPQDWNRIHDELERDTRALAACLEMLDEMTEFFEIEYGPDSTFITAEPGRRGEGRYPLDFYIDWLRTAAIRTPWRLREGHGHGVLVATTRDIQGLEFDAVFVCGLVDGEFPSRYVPETFLGKPLPNAEDRQIRRERMEFYGAVTSFRQHLILSYHRYAGETRIVRSSFVDALLRITTLEASDRVMEVEELRVVRARARNGESPHPLLDPLVDVVTYEGLAEEIGATLWSGGDVPRIDSVEGEEMAQNLRHTVRIEQGRLAGAELDVPEFMGLISGALNEEDRATLALRRDREYSPSQLELYARCPFKYFARRILHIVPVADYDVTITPLERGLLLHSVLFKLYSELRDREELPITSERREQALARARELAREEIKGIVFDHPYWQIDQERLLGSELLGGLLQSWINYDSDNAEKGKTSLVPGFFEVDFGSGREGGGIDGRLSTGEPVQIHRLNLRGRVDRVEIARRDDILYFAVADYKTGKAPTRRDITEGTSLQLMLYIEVIRRLLAEHFDLPLSDVLPVGGFYYELDARAVASAMKAIFVPNDMKASQKRPDGLVKVNIDEKDPASIEDLVDIVDDVLERAAGYIEGIATGQFPLTPHDTNKVCRLCEFEPACRIRERLR